MSPFVKSLFLVDGDAAYLLQYYGESKTLYSAIVARGSEERIGDEEVLRVGRVLTRLMALIGKATRSRYYSYTGPLQVEERRLVYRPYISPTTTARIYIEGNRIVADAGDVFKKKIRTHVDVEKTLRGILDKLRARR